MKILCGALVVVVALSASACGSGRPATPPIITVKKGPATAEVSAHARLPHAVRKAVETYLRESKHPSKYETVNAIEVYGPDTRNALNAASDPHFGSIVTPAERKTYYLTVRYGHFICPSCSRPPGGSSPRGTVEARIWAPTGRGPHETDFALMRKLPRAVSRIHRLIRIRLR